MYLYIIWQLGGISYHDFDGYRDEDDDSEGHQRWRKKITNDLGPNNKVSRLTILGSLSLSRRDQSCR